jgi:hypothetical protein
MSLFYVTGDDDSTIQREQRFALEVLRRPPTTLDRTAASLWWTAGSPKAIVVTPRYRGKAIGASLHSQLNTLTEATQEA